MTNRLGELQAALAELRQRHRQLEGPAHLAGVLIAATHAAQSQRRQRIGWRAWVIAAAIVVAVVAWRANPSALIGNGHPFETRLAPAAEAFPPAAKAPASASGVSPVMTLGVPVGAVPSEPLTGFVALPGSAGLPQPMQTSVLQLQVRKDELRRYGLEMPPSTSAELVRADFVIGDDGLARAVRFVH